MLPGLLLLQAGIAGPIADARAVSKGRPEDARHDANAFSWQDVALRGIPREYMQMMFDWSALGISNVRTLVDVGAAEGEFLREALRQFPEIEKWIAIEMLPERARVLFQMAIDAKHAEFYRCAVGESPGRLPMLRTGSPNASSLLPCNPQVAEWRGWAPDTMASEDIGMVAVQTLDQMCAPYAQIDLMKIDIQGYEGRAIRGGRETLKRTRHLLIEVLICQHYEGQSTPEEIEDEMDSLGFLHEHSMNSEYSREGALLQLDRHYVNTRFKA